SRRENLSGKSENFSSGAASFEEGLAASSGSAGARGLPQRTRRSESSVERAGETARLLAMELRRAIRTHELVPAKRARVKSAVGAPPFRCSGREPTMRTRDEHGRLRR